jgi:hypothetical protein
MISTDYISNLEITRLISWQTKRFRNTEDKDDCKQDIYAELYAFSPIDIDEAMTIINRVSRRHLRRVVRISETEIAVRPPTFNDGHYMKGCHTSPWDTGAYPQGDLIAIP